MKEFNYQWHKIADTENEIRMEENGIAVIEWEGKKLCLAKWSDRWFGFAYLCPHAGALLSKGYVDALGNVVCASHHYRFSLQHGRDSAGEGYHLRRWPVEKREDGIYIGMEETEFLGRRE
jgi:nitrite reductase/ring-hydroxylating ferredoxin subunit